MTTKNSAMSGIFYLHEFESCCCRVKRFESSSSKQKCIPCNKESRNFNKTSLDGVVGFLLKDSQIVTCLDMHLSKIRKSSLCVNAHATCKEWGKQIRANQATILEPKYSFHKGLRYSTSQLWGAYIRIWSYIITRENILQVLAI